MRAARFLRGGVPSTVTRERGEADLAKRKRGVPLEVAILGKGLRVWGGGTLDTEVLGGVGLVLLGWREMKCEPLNAAAAAS